MDLIVPPHIEHRPSDVAAYRVAELSDEQIEAYGDEGIDAEPLWVLVGAILCIIALVGIAWFFGLTEHANVR